MVDILKAKQIKENKSIFTSDTFSLDGPEDGDVKNWKTYKTIYDTFAPVRTAIDVTSDFTVQHMSVVSRVDELELGENKDNAVVIISDLLDKFGFNGLVHKICTNLLIYGNCFVEIGTDEGGISELKVIPTQTMRMNIDKYGNLVKGKAYIQKTADNKEITFSEDEIVHFSFNAPHSGTYGQSLIKPLVCEINTLNNMVDLSKVVVKKYAAPLIHVKVGDLATELFPVQEDIDQWSSDIEDLDANQDIVTGPEVDLKPIGFEGKALDLSKILKLLFDNLIIGLKVPRDLLGLSEGSNKAQADTTYEAFRTRIKILQRNIARTVELKIFQIQLDLIWKNAEIKEAVDKDKGFIAETYEIPEIIWEEAESEDEKERIDMILKLKEKGLLSLNKAIELLPEEFREDDAGIAILKAEDEDKKELAKQAFNKPEEKKPNPFAKKKEHTCGTQITESAGRNEQIPKGDKRWVKEQMPLEDAYAKFVVKKLKEAFNQVEAELTAEKLESYKVITEKKNVNLDDVNRIMDNFYRETRTEGLSKPRDAFESGLNRAALDTGETLTFNLEDYDALFFLDEKNTDLLLTVSEELKGRIKSSLRMGVMKGESITKMKARLKGIEETYKGRLETIARTEVSNAINMGRLNGYAQAGLKKVEWLAAMDACPECAALNGNEMTINESQGQIPLHPNCRCTFIPVVD